MCQMTYPNHEELIDPINSTLQTKIKIHLIPVSKAHSQALLISKLSSFREVSLDVLHVD